LGERVEWSGVESREGRAVYVRLLKFVGWSVERGAWRVEEAATDGGPVRYSSEIVRVTGNQKIRRLVEVQTTADVKKREKEANSLAGAFHLHLRNSARHVLELASVHVS
jgi:hypothetical protein